MVDDIVTTTQVIRVLVETGKVAGVVPSRGGVTDRWWEWSTLARYLPDLRLLVVDSLVEGEDDETAHVSAADHAQAVRLAVAFADKTRAKCEAKASRISAEANARIKGGA